MPDISLYDELIMDHIRNARNFRVPDAVDRQAAGSNPLCGDEITVYLRLEGERIADIAFQCTCCGISMASTSIMTETVNGRSLAEAKSLLDDVITMLRTRSASTLHTMTPERLALLETVTKFPARIGCATLSWTALESALSEVRV